MTETPTALALPQGIRWVKLVCRLGSIVSDLPDDPDAYPEHVASSGEVSLSTSPNRIIWQEPDGIWRSASIKGRKYTIRATDGELVDLEGRIGVWVPDPLSGGVEPSAFTITATVVPAEGDSWNVTIGGTTPLPDVVDLVRSSSVSPSTGVSDMAARLAALEAVVQGMTKIHVGPEAPTDTTMVWIPTQPI